MRFRASKTGNGLKHAPIPAHGSFLLTVPRWFLCCIFFFLVRPWFHMWRICLSLFAYLNIWKISPPKTESSQIKILIVFHVSAQNIDCGYSLEPPRRGGSNEYPQSMF